MSKLCSFKNAKYISVRDRRLGGFYWLCVLLLFLWLIADNLLRKLGYLKFRSFVGNLLIGVSLNLPPGCAHTPMQQLRYCCNVSSCPSGRQGFRRRCRYLEPESAAQISKQNIFIPSFVYEAVQERNDACFTALTREGKECTPLWNEISTETYYVADIERFTILLDHQIEQREFGIHAGSHHIDGAGELLVTGSSDSQRRLCQLYGSRPRTPCYIKAHQSDGQRDYFRISTLLQAADVDLDDIHPEYQELGQNKTIRSKGAIIILMIVWSNWDTWKGLRSLNYFYTVRKIPHGKWYESSHSWLTKPTKQQIQFHNGIQFRIEFDGQVAQFDAFMLAFFCATFYTSLGLLKTVIGCYARNRHNLSLLGETVEISADDIKSLANVSAENLQQLLAARRLPCGGSVERQRWRLLEDGWRPTSSTAERSPRSPGMTQLVDPRLWHV